MKKYILNAIKITMFLAGCSLMLLSGAAGGIYFKSALGAIGGFLFGFVAVFCLTGIWLPWIERKLED